MRRFLHICLAIAVSAVVLSSCSGKTRGKIIPRSRMSKIYAEMLLTDQWINTYRQHLNEADTCWVYEPIFNRYGYTSDDFRASVAHYLKDTERYGRMLKQSTLILEKKEKELKKEKARLDAIEALRSGMNELRPEKFFYLGGLYDMETFVEGEVRFYVDTTGEGNWFFDPYKGMDSLYAGPMLLIRESLDSAIMAAQDSIASANVDSVAVVDSIVAADAIVVADSIAVVENGPVQRRDSSMMQAAINEIMK